VLWLWQDGLLDARVERIKNIVVTDLGSQVVRMVLEGDTRIVYDRILSLAWITKIEAVCDNSRSVWIVHIHGNQPTPTDLLRVVLADRRLQVIEFRSLHPAELELNQPMSSS
jgi:hypothetical protein